MEILHYPPDDKSVSYAPPSTSIDRSELRLSLADELSTGFDFVTLQAFHDVGLDSICLWHRNGKGLEFYSRFVELPDADGYRECGILCVGYPAFGLHDFQKIQLPSDFIGPLRISILSFVESNTTFESGLVIQGQAGSLMTLISGAFPFTIEIATSFDDELPLFEDRRGGRFQPERDLTEYSRGPLDP